LPFLQPAINPELETVNHRLLRHQGHDVRGEQIRVMRGLDLKFGKQAIIVVDEELPWMNTELVVSSAIQKSPKTVSRLFVFLGCTPREPGHLPSNRLNQPSSWIELSHYVLLA